MNAINVRPKTERERTWVRQTAAGEWGSDTVVVHSEVFRPHLLPGFVAESGGALVGFIAYRRMDDALEIVGLASTLRNIGVGTAMLQAAVEEARRSTCSRVWLVTTNDNLNALRFYQKRGFHIVAVHPNAVSAARAVKPEIPEVGDGGIPIRDEIELELTLHALTDSDG
jgi:ribosomal protein S18 acetylase RimI-like enzyme